MKEESQAVKEFRIAFDEFFKGKPKPKNEELESEDDFWEEGTFF